MKKKIIIHIIYIYSKSTSDNCEPDLHFNEIYHHMKMSDDITNIY